MDLYDSKLYLNYFLLVEKVKVSDEVFSKIKNYLIDSEISFYKKLKTTLKEYSTQQNIYFFTIARDVTSHYIMLVWR